ncbi:tripartite tricarboxylate transporter substrate binding protein [Pusillimonas sp. ANT_WB101]|uniref:Bug family tripartite tricarboxylate transporter substrate binding protein n=1 Tax=Pusillimonas sp. ANT_WB101 TaxID=2597356 RepID=UPI0011ED5DD2|nr:tripartite tricarboxylate transporter substrate binding protein [Pusillimonas sp. ANT_WB101]KAA0889995.1 tripartite tricarboxylate transporter substrate binding protein [Pusillimonas sp. ANT_WB101]
MLKCPHFLKSSKSARFALMVGLMSTAAAPIVNAEDSYPDHPISIVVPYSPGGTTDLISRILAEGLSKDLGQAVIIENRAGASGMIGTGIVVKAKPDGYTLGMGGSTSLTVAPYLRSLPPYDSRTDLTPIGMVAGGPFILVVSPKSEAQTLKEFVKLARSKPGELNFGSSGIGSMHHILAVKFNQMMDIDATHVPFKGGVESATNLVAGNIDYLFESVSSILPMIQDGRVKALAVTGSERLEALLDVPTAAEATDTDFTGVSFIGLVGPKGLPPSIVNRLNDALATTLSRPDVRTKIQKLGSKPEFIPASKFNEIIINDVEAWSDVMREAKLPKM